MNKTKHTPGPWEIGALLGDPDGKSYEYPTIYHIDSIRGTTYVADIMVALSPEAMPNARLIAAAPELLELAESCLEWSESRDGSPETDEICLRTIAEHCRAAIAKATADGTPETFDFSGREIEG